MTWRSVRCDLELVAIPPESGAPGRPDGQSDDLAAVPHEGIGPRGAMSARIDAMMADIEGDGIEGAGDPDESPGAEGSGADGGVPQVIDAD